MSSPSNIRICPATAEIAAHELADLLIGSRSALFKQRDRRHDLPGCAVAALKTVVSNERFLNRMQLSVPRQSLDRRDISTVALRGQHQTRQHPFPLEKDRAGPARSLIAAHLRAGHPEVLAQRVEQRYATVQPQPPGAPLDVQRQSNGGVGGIVGHRCTSRLSGAWTRADRATGRARTS
jgi:hypothetical protein